MSDPILDLIDGAIWDHGDAMRWTPPVSEDEEPEITRPTYADIARWYDVPVELIDCDSPPRGIITALPPTPEREPDLQADLAELFRRMSESLMRHYEPGHDSHGRVPYEHLTDDERQTLHDWCTHHDIDHRTVPIDPDIERVGDLWVIEVHDQRDGKSYIDPATGDIARKAVTRPYKTDLPWRRP